MKSSITLRSFPIIVVLTLGPCLSAQIPIEGPVLSYEKIGRLKTRTTHEIASSHWSVGGETMDREYTVYQNWCPYLEELGIKKIRLQGGWARCERVKGEYSWKWLDEIIFDLPRRGIEPWVCLCYGNPLYGKGEVRLDSAIDTDRDTRQAWLHWVAAMVKRYQGVVRIWEIWNKPNGLNPAGVYAELLIQTAGLIRYLQPESRIMGFSLAGVDVPFAAQVLEILTQKNRTQLVDYLSYHPYSFNPNDSYDKVDELYGVMKTHAPGMELYQGENGAPSEWRETKALSNYDWTETTQAKWALRRMLGDLGRDIPSSIFSIIDMKYPDEMNRKGLLQANEDKTVHHRKQAFYAVQNLAAVFDNNLVMIGEFTCEVCTHHQYSSFGYRHNPSGNELFTIWLHTNRPTDYNATTPVDVKIQGLVLRDPVWLDLRTGWVYQIPEDSYAIDGNGIILSALPVYDSPVVICERQLMGMEP
jgi:hypothetical protein